MFEGIIILSITLTDQAKRQMKCCSSWCRWCWRWW